MTGESGMILHEYYMSG